MRYWGIGPAILLVVLTSFGTAAQACMAVAPLELNDIKRADVVVVGRIANYRVVLDPIVRENMKRLANDPDISPELRAFYSMERGFLSDYAKFDVLVDEVLAGQAPKTLTVTWDNSTFSEPDNMPSGPFLIALRDPKAGLMLPLRGPSATISPSPEPDSLTVLQAPCSDAFIFETTTEEARTSRRILGR